MDGSISYSDTKMVHYADLIDFILFPNPADKFVKVNLETLIGKEVEIKLFNTLGLEVKSIQLEEVYSKYYQIDLQNLREGHYMVWIHTPNQRPKSKNLIITKF